MRSPRINACFPSIPGFKTKHRFRGPQRTGASIASIHRKGKSLQISKTKTLVAQGVTDFLGLRLVIHGVPLLGLLSRNGPLTLSKLLRLANSRIRHIGCWGRREVRKECVGEGEVVVVDGGWFVEIGKCDYRALAAAQSGIS